MRKQIRKIEMTACVLALAGTVFGCGRTAVYDKYDKEEKQSEITAEEARRESGQAGGKEENPERDEFADGSGTSFNETIFFEKAQAQGIVPKEAENCWERLLADDIFQDGAMELTGLVIEDMDGNGQKDMLVMILDHEEKPFYGSGRVWIYMNEEEPYCFADEDCSYYGDFESFAADIDNDGNVEIVFSAQGTGCGAAGDSYKAVFKYRKDGRGGQSRKDVIERMELPSDLLEEYDRGLEVIIDQEKEKNRYSAYCPYLDEKISFGAESISAPGNTSREVGGNARGYFNLRPVKYEGKNALQASEYLYGEGGISHNVAMAQFIIRWDENGTAYIAEWWIEGSMDRYS